MCAESAGGQLSEQTCIAGVGLDGHLLIWQLYL